MISCVYSQITNTRKWRKTEKDSLNDALIVYDEKKYLIALPIFENIHINHPDEEFIKYMYAKCALYRSDRYDEAYRLLSEVYSKNKKVDNIEYDLARAAHFTNRFDEANKLVDSYMSNRKTTEQGRRNGEILKKYIKYAIYYTSNPTKAKISNLGNVLNSATDEYVPTITADESMMIFTYRGPKSKGDTLEDGQRPEDVYMTVKQDDIFQSPVALDSINTLLHDAAISLSHDGQILFVYRDNGDDHGDIYQSFLIGDVFTRPYKLKGQVNSYSWDGHCSLSPDGQTLYFSSERPGGYGGKDIYRATLLPDSTWGNVVNLGDTINTSFDEDAPFIHPDGVTLYFSSKGKTSMGGYDIFQTTMDLQDSVFKMTENLGYPINSADDDIYFVLSATGANGYYSSGKKGGQGMKDIYLIETNFNNPRLLYLVKGKTTSDSIPVETNIKVEITSRNNALFKSTNSNSKSGQYLISLPAGADYKITYTYKDREPQTFTLTTINLPGFTQMIKDVRFDTKDTTKVTVTPTLAVVTNTVAAPPTDTFVPNPVQQKTLSYMDKFGDISAEGLEFRVQIAAYKYPKNYTYKHLKGLGSVDNVLLDDGITRITIGGKFNTIRKAWEHNRKVIDAGQKDAFVTAIYKGKRVYLDELIKMGIFVTKE